MRCIKAITKGMGGVPGMAALPHPGHVGLMVVCQDGMKGIRVVGCVKNEFYPLWPCDEG